MTYTSHSAVMLPGQQAAPAGPVDLTNMYVMHHAFRRDLADFQASVADALLDDHDRWKALRRRWHLFASALHSHHSAEDAGLWPLLLERAADHGDHDARTVLEAMQAEHARIDPVLAECTEGFSRLANGTSEGSAEGVRQALARSLAATGELLHGHLGHEERDAMALVQRYLVNADWLRVEKEHFRPAYSPREVWSVVPWALLGLPEEVRRRNLDEAGLPIKILWRLSRRGFARGQAAAFGRTGGARTRTGRRAEPGEPASDEPAPTDPAGVLRRVGAAAFGVAAAMSIPAVFATHPPSDPAHNREFALGADATDYRVATALQIYALTPVILGMFPLYATIARSPARRWAIAGLVTTVVGAGFLLPGTGYAAFVVPAAGVLIRQGHEQDVLRLLNQIFAEPGWIPVFLGGFAYSIGLFLTSVAMWRSGRLPRWTAALLGAAALIGLVTFLDVTALASLGALLWIAAFASLSVGIWRR